MTQRVKSEGRRTSQYLWKPHIYFSVGETSNVKGCWCYNPASTKLTDSTRAYRRIIAYNDKAWAYVKAKFKERKYLN
mgnify:CR=1 FL=1